MNDDEMLIKYAKIIKNYCVDFEENKKNCKTCPFSHGESNCCSLHIFEETRVTYNKEELDDYNTYIESENNEALMIHKYMLKLREHCARDKEYHGSRCDYTSCVFNKNSLCKLSMFPRKWNI